MSRKRSSTEAAGSNRMLWTVFGGGALFVVVLAAVWFGGRSQPQLKFDEDVFNTVDALFTAVTSRDTERLAACEARLEKYQTDGRLTGSAATALDGIVRQAREGGWEPAAKKLYAFMLGQRRES